MDNNQPICQCCGMPLDETTFSTEPDGTVNKEYCKWCYADGKFTYDDMETLINFCAEHMATEEFPAEQMRAYMSEMLPKLKHWKEI
ncbi:MAG: zinc ribbon domain-containing protein [Lachnospiraceae bacterium]|nr:zinc ribbon domain-containing protein [Lachnospiraceae bacterium]